MAWMIAAAQVAASVYMNVSGAKTAVTINNINTALDRYVTSKKNETRTVAAAKVAAEASLARFVQSTNNNRRLTAGGAQLEANTVNTLRGIDVATKGGFTDKIRAAEAMGAQAARQAVSGAGGSAGDSVAVASQLRIDMAAQDAYDRMGSAINDSAIRASQIMSQTIGGMDSNVIVESFDNAVESARIYGQGESTSQAVLQGLLSNTKDITKVAGEAYSGIADLFKTSSSSGVSTGDFARADRGQAGATFKMDTGDSGGGFFGWLSS